MYMHLKQNTRTYAFENFSICLSYPLNEFSIAICYMSYFTNVDGTNGMKTGAIIIGRMLPFSGEYIFGTIDTKLMKIAGHG